MSNSKTKLDELTAQIQKECHDLAWALKEQSPETFAKCKSQDMTNVFLFKKLASIELRLRALESTKRRSDDYLNMHTPLM